MLGKSEGVSAGWRSESDDRVDAADRGRAVRPVDGRDAAPLDWRRECKLRPSRRLVADRIRSVLRLRALPARDTSEQSSAQDDKQTSA